MTAPAARQTASVGPARIGGPYRTIGAARPERTWLPGDASSSHGGLVTAPHQQRPRRWLTRRDCSWAKAIARPALPRTIQIVANQ
jgi:hypothetical protein